MIDSKELLEIAKRSASLQANYAKEMDAYEKKQSKSGPLSAVMGTDNKPKMPGIPDLYPGYATAVEWFTQVLTHSQKGSYPYWLFEYNSPNQTESEANYVKNNYRQTTLEVFKDFVDTYSRAFHDTNYDVNYKEQPAQYKNQTYRDYINKSLPIYGSLDTFTFEFLSPAKLQDAMGVVIVFPGALPTVEIMEGDEIDEVIDPSKLLEPFPVLFHCQKVMAFNELEKYCVVLTNEKSEVKYGERTVKDGMVFLAVDDKNYYRIFQVGKKSEYNFDVEITFNHDLGWMPAKKVGGITVEDDDVLLEQSPFLFAVDTLDEILIDAALLRGVKSTCSYPYRIMVGDACDNQMKYNGETVTCNDGYFHLRDHAPIMCDACHGKGMKDRVSPYGVMLIKPKTTTTEGDQISPDKAMMYASPSTETQVFLRKEIDYNFIKVYNLLHIRKDDSKIQGGEQVTATEIANSNKALMAGIKTHTDQLFDIYEWLHKTIGTLRYGTTGFVMPEIIRPNNYDFMTMEEFMDQISKAIKDNQPAIITESLIESAATKVFFKDPEKRKIFSLIRRADRLFAMTPETIDKKIARRLVDSWEVILHDSITRFIDDLIREDETFLDKDYSVQYAALKERAQTLLNGITPIPASPAVSQAQARLQAIINQT